MGDNMNIVTEALQNGNIVLFHILLPGVEISTKDDVVASMDDSNGVIRIVLEETESMIKFSKTDISDIHVDDNHYRLIMESGVEVRFDVF